MNKVTLEELKEHCIRMIQKAKRLGFPEDSKGRQKHEIFLQLIREHEQRQSTDAVSREEAVKVLRADPSFICTGDKTQAITDILSLPSVTPKRPKGEWVKYSIPRCGEQHYKCSHCDEYVNFGLYGDFYTKDFIYCPHCGADMRGVSECSEENKN